MNRLFAPSSRKAIMKLENPRSVQQVKVTPYRRKLEIQQPVDQLACSVRQAFQPDPSVPNASPKLEIQQLVDQLHRPVRQPFKQASSWPKPTCNHRPPSVMDRDFLSNEPSTQRPANVLCHVASTTMSLTHSHTSSSATQQKPKKTTPTKGVARRVLHDANCPARCPARSVAPISAQRPQHPRLASASPLVETRPCSRYHRGPLSRIANVDSPC